MGLSILLYSGLKALIEGPTDLEFEGINGNVFLADFKPALGIAQQVQPVAGRNANVMAALRTHRMIAFEVSAVKYRVARGTLDPQALGH